MEKSDKNKLPLISIITVTYNAEKTLDYTIQSVINQNYSNLEYIIIDGGSTDNTLEIIRRYDKHISYWKSEPDKGIFDAMNKGIDAANGDWVIFLGAGDLLLNVLHHVKKELICNRTIYYGDVYKIDTNEIYGGKFSPFRLAVKNICHQAIFYPLSALKKYKYNIAYKALADHHLNMVCFGDKNYQFKYIPILISIYEGDGFSVENSIDENFFADKIKIVKENFPFFVFYYATLRRKLAKLFK
jgi:glycosyltransferase involved in cell wall biosynthesis